jgi:hypothetical protein
MVFDTTCSDLACSLRAACIETGEGKTRCSAYRALSIAASPAHRVADFAAEMLAKWEKGAAEHGPVMPADPLDEAMAECVDLSNYVMAAFYRLKSIKEKTGSLSIERLKELGIGEQ